MLFWMSSETIRDLLGTSATITTVLQFLTGCLICRNYILKKSTGEVCAKLGQKREGFYLKTYFQTSSLPFTSGLLSCSLWLRYGVLTNETTLMLVNGIGVFLFSLYCISYFLFTVNKRRMSHQLLLVILMISFAIFYSKFEENDVEASRLIGMRILSQKWKFLLHFISFWAFRTSLLLSRCVFLRKSPHKAQVRHRDEKHELSSISHYRCVIFRDPAVGYLWISDW